MPKSEIFLARVLLGHAAETLSPQTLVKAEVTEVELAVELAPGAKAARAVEKAVVQALSSVSVLRAWRKALHFDEAPEGTRLCCG